MLSVFNTTDQTLVQEFKPAEPLIAGDIEIVSDLEVFLFGVKTSTEKGIFQWAIGSEEVKNIKDSPTSLPNAFDSVNNRMAYVSEDIQEIYLFDMKSGQKSTVDIVR